MWDSSADHKHNTVLLLFGTCWVKGTVAQDFVGPACMNRSGGEIEPLLVFKFFCYSLDFWQGVNSCQDETTKFVNPSRRFQGSPGILV